MAAPAATSRAFPLIPVIAGSIVVLCAVLAGLYLARPGATPSERAVPVEAKAYLKNLALSDVAMEASENFMKQQVVEVKGFIANNGPRALRSVDVYCLFYGVNGQELHRERLPIVNARNSVLRSGEKRAFRLPFDAVPEGWNQSMPKMVIAQITFAQ